MVPVQLNLRHSAVGYGELPAPSTPTAISASRTIAGVTVRLRDVRASTSKRATAARSTSGLRGRRSSSRSCSVSVCHQLSLRQPVQQQPAQQVVIRRPNLDGGDRAQPAGKITQSNGPTRRRQARGEQHGTPQIARGVQQMQQRGLIGPVGVIDGHAAGDAISGNPDKAGPSITSAALRSAQIRNR